MNPNHDPHGSTPSLRRRAERLYADRRSVPSTPPNSLDAQHMLQELEIHQIELEMQNLELEQARKEAEEAREFYRDLYDFAPVGYFTLSREGNILMANLTGARLLGLPRDELTGCSFSQWIVPNAQAGFRNFFSRVLRESSSVSVELDILQVNGTPFSADIEALKGRKDRGCRMMVTDATQRIAEQKAKRLLKISTRSNRRLQAEVVHWREVETSLEAARAELRESLEHADGKPNRLLRLSNALLRAQEEERKRISRKLHDKIVLALKSIQHELERLVP